MTTSSSDIGKIRACAANGLKRLKIEALLGHRLTGGELTEYRRASAVYDLELRKRRQERRYEHLSQNERAFKNANAANEVGLLPPTADPVRRERCRSSLVDFIETYCMEGGGFFRVPPSERMHGIAEHLQAVVTHGGREHIRVARAHGKTSLVKAACVYALVYGFRHFVVAVSASERDARAFIRDVFALCEQGETFAADFPEIAVPLRKLNGVMQRAANQTYGGVRTNIVRSAERVVLPTVAGSVSSGAILVARGLTSASRGLVAGSSRPDLLVLDDLQTDKMARNQSRISECVELIEKNLLGLAGHDRQMAAAMTSTPIAPDDLSEQFAHNPTWKTFTFPMVITWPACWGAERGDLWSKYFQIRQESIARGEMEHAAANAFYKLNRETMDAGAEVLSPDFYDRETELSGIQHAMNLRFAIGEDAFATEYQMAARRGSKSYQISVPLIVSRVRAGLPPLTMPSDDFIFVSCATDLNPAYGFSTAMTAFDRRQTACVLWYGIHRTDILLDLPEAERLKRVYAELVANGAEIRRLCLAAKIRQLSWGVDAGFDTEIVYRFAQNAPLACGMHPTPMFGRAAAKYNPDNKRRITADRDGTLLCQDGANRYMIWNADQWRETAQRAWLGEIGSPGGITLYDGRTDGSSHAEFAAQIVAETLEGKTVCAGRPIYVWRQNGKKHDYGDAVAMCYALAANAGIGTVSAAAPRAARPRRNANDFYCQVLS